MNYNSIRHSELLKRSKDLEKQGQHLYDENQDEYLELLDYRSTLENHIFWENRRQFMLLMENFLNGIIDGEEFSDNFSALRRKYLDSFYAFEIDSEKLKDFQLDVRSKGFASFISFLRAECDNFEEDYDNKEFYDSIKDCFLKLQKALNEE